MRQQLIALVLVILTATLCFFSHVTAQTVLSPVGASTNPKPVAASSIAKVQTVYDEMLARFNVLNSRCDSNAPFSLLYLYMTSQARDFISSSYFDDGDIMADFTVAFAHRYADAIDKWVTKTGVDQISAPWYEAFSYGATNKSSVLEDLYLGMNAHINYDLGQIVYQIYNGGSQYKDDYDRINDLLVLTTAPASNDIAGRYDASMNSTLVGFLAPVVVQTLIEWRNNAWLNGVLLSNAIGPVGRQTVLASMTLQSLTAAVPFKSYNLAGLGQPTSPARTAYCFSHRH
jgi:hypothetical protein